jgi:branched-chain amino acid transport system substrate-binding protein
MRTSLVVWLGVLSLLLAACGSSSKGTSSANTAAGSGTTPPASTGAAGGSPITVSTICALSGASVSPTGCSVVEAYFAEINAEGGIQGRPLKVDTCDNQSLPTTTTSCLREAILNHNVLAMVGNEEDNGFSSLSKSTPIANIGPTTLEADTYTSPDSFPVSDFSELGGSLGALVSYELHSPNAKSPLLMLCEYESCSVVKSALNTKYNAAGISMKSIVVPIASPSFGQYVAEAQHDNADFVLVAEGSGALAGIVQASQQVNYNPTFGLTFSCYDQPTLTLLGSGSYTAYCPSPFKSWTTAGSAMKAVMDKYGPSKWAWDYEGVASWIAAHMFVQAAKTIKGPITRATILTAMNHLSNFTNEFLPGSIDFSKPGPASYAPAVRNYDWYIYKVSDGQLDLLTPTPVNVPPINTGGQ